MIGIAELRITLENQKLDVGNPKRMISLILLSYTFEVGLLMWAKADVFIDKMNASQILGVSYLQCCQLATIYETTVNLRFRKGEQAVSKSEDSFSCWEVTNSICSLNRFAYFEGEESSEEGEEYLMFLQLSRAADQSEIAVCQPHCRVIGNHQTRTEWITLTRNLSSKWKSILSEERSTTNYLINEPLSLDTVYQERTMVGNQCLSSRFMNN
ncbi:unnamed protein product, partial [Nesidiocoris tenuis]